jgi:hypothetical protein
MEAEFRLHLDLRAEELVRAGLTPAEAAPQARLEFGSAPFFADRGRDARGLRAFDSLRFSMLDLKSPSVRRQRARVHCDVLRQSPEPRHLQHSEAWPMGPIAALGTNPPLDSLGETAHHLS